jgi:tetratricopeptide (TPR) repeat protein
VVQHGDRLRVQTELLRTTDGSQIWGEHYKRSISDVFEIEEEIAKEITESLKLRLTSDENKQLGKRYTQNKEAYELYLQGKYLWNRRGSASLTRAVALFEQAIEKDPAYALAWAGIAECYTTYGFYEVVSPGESMPKAREAAQRALAIDSTLAEPHACLGWIKSLYEWDWPGGEREFRKAIELNPNLASAHYWFAFALAAQHRWEEGIAESKRALEIDPASPRIYTILGPCLAGAGRTDEALEACRKGLELDPLFPNSHFAIALAYEANRRLEESIPHLEQAHRNAADFPFFAGVLGRAYGLAGQTTKAQEILNELLRESECRYVAPFDIALVYCGLGAKDEEFAWLEKAWNDRSPWFVVCAGFTPWLLISEPDPRFDDLQRRMNLAE